MIDIKLTGRCQCGAMRYRLTDAPMIVHCCHCRDCQRETGSGFVVNAPIEADRLAAEGAVERVLTPSASSERQEIVRCAACYIALWSHYPRRRRTLAFVRAGTLDHPNAATPDVHIFTRSKLPWVGLPAEVPAFEELYPEPTAIWSETALARAKALPPVEPRW